MIGNRRVHVDPEKSRTKMSETLVHSYVAHAIVVKSAESMVETRRRDNSTISMTWNFPTKQTIPKEEKLGLLEGSAIHKRVVRVSGALEEVDELPSSRVAELGCSQLLDGQGLECWYPHPGIFDGGINGREV